MTVEADSRCWVRVLDLPDPDGWRYHTGLLPIGSVYISVYGKTEVYVPDELAEQARSRGLNVSAMTQAAIVEELERTSLSAWLDSLPTRVAR